MTHGRWGYIKHKCRCEICVQAEHDYQDTKQRTIICPVCGTQATVKRRAKFCSHSCAVAHGNTTTPRVQSIKQPKPCPQCNVTHMEAGKYCTPECRDTAWKLAAKANRSPLRAALQDYDMDAVRLALTAKATMIHGCWVWPKLDGEGYPCITSQDRGLHRQVLEAKHGQPLGTQAAHHMCGNRSCVNPDHLQPVTHRDNTAEMLQRRAYLARIAELEAVVAGIAPDHPVLNVIAVA